MKVTKDNFTPDLVSSIVADIKKAAFVAIDTELTGLFTDPELRGHRLDSIDTRFARLRDAGARMQILQYGICVFVPEDGQAAAPTGDGVEAAPGAPGTPEARGKFVAKPYSFYILPASSKVGIAHADPAWGGDASSVFQHSALQFLSRNHFDFNLVAGKGIPFLSREAEQSLRQLRKAEVLGKFVSDNTGPALAEKTKLYVVPQSAPAAGAGAPAAAGAGTPEAPALPMAVVVPGAGPQPLIPVVPSPPPAAADPSATASAAPAVAAARPIRIGRPEDIAFILELKQHLEAWMRSVEAYYASPAAAAATGAATGAGLSFVALDPVSFDSLDSEEDVAAGVLAGRATVRCPAFTTPFVMNGTRRFWARVLLSELFGTRVLARVEPSADATATATAAATAAEASEGTPATAVQANDKRLQFIYIGPEAEAELQRQLAALRPAGDGAGSAAAGAITLRDAWMGTETRRLLPAVEESLASARGFRAVIDALSEARVPVVGHNCFLDMTHTAAKFIGRPPMNATEWSRQLLELFPVIFDTKHLVRLPRSDSSHPGLSEAFQRKTSLGDAFNVVNSVYNGNAFVPADSLAAAAASVASSAGGPRRNRPNNNSNNAGSAAAATGPAEGGADAEGANEPSRVPVPCYIDFPAQAVVDLVDPGASAEAALLKTAPAVDAAVSGAAGDATIAALTPVVPDLATTAVAHDAGYDAYMTGVVFARMAPLLARGIFPLLERPAAALTSGAPEIVPAAAPAPSATAAAEAKEALDKFFEPLPIGLLASLIRSTVDVAGDDWATVYESKCKDRDAALGLAASSAPRPGASDAPAVARAARLRAYANVLKQADLRDQAHHMFFLEHAAELARKGTPRASRTAGDTPTQQELSNTFLHARSLTNRSAVLYVSGIPPALSPRSLCDKLCSVLGIKPERVDERRNVEKVNDQTVLVTLPTVFHVLEVKNHVAEERFAQESAAQALAASQNAARPQDATIADDEADDEELDQNGNMLGVPNMPHFLGKRRRRHAGALAEGATASDTPYAFEDEDAQPPSASAVFMQKAPFQSLLRFAGLTAEDVDVPLHKLSIKSYDEYLLSRPEVFGLEFSHETAERWAPAASPTMAATIEGLSLGTTETSPTGSAASSTPSEERPRKKPRSGCSIM